LSRKRKTKFHLKPGVVPVDYVGSEARGNMDNGSLRGLGDAFTTYEPVTFIHFLKFCLLLIPCNRAVGAETLTDEMISCIMRCAAPQIRESYDEFT
jgi:hypothetical protein